MSADRSVRGWVLTQTRIWIDALTYAGVVTLSTFFVAMTIGIVTGGGYARGNIVLFVAAWVILAYATVQLWPSSPEDVDTDPVDGSVRSTTRVQSIARELPPARWVALPAPRDRMTAAGKLLVSSVLILALSFVIETVFGVG